MKMNSELNSMKQYTLTMLSLNLQSLLNHHMQ